MVLQTDVSLVLVATHIVQQLEGVGEVAALFKLAGLQHLGPFRSPEVILYHVLSVLSVYHGTLEAHNLGGVPLAIGLSVLRLSRNHIIE